MNFNRIVFLDFDGVISTSRTHFMDLDPICMTPLQRIIRETQALIVISSSWRVGRELDEFVHNFERFGLGASVVGMTPVTNGTTRGREIQLWLERNPTNVFVIIDDEIWDMSPFENRTVQTRIETGLTEEDADRVIQMFQNSLTY